MDSNYLLIRMDQNPSSMSKDKLQDTINQQLGFVTTKPCYILFKPKNAFYHVSADRQITKLSVWPTDSIQTLLYMFYGCSAKVMHSNPDKENKKEVIDQRAILLIKKKSSWEIGSRSNDGKYIQNNITDQNLIRLLNQYSSVKEIEDKTVLAELNTLLTSLESSTLCNESRVASDKDVEIIQSLTNWCDIHKKYARMRLNHEIELIKHQFNAMGTSYSDMESQALALTHPLIHLGECLINLVYIGKGIILLIPALFDNPYKSIPDVCGSIINQTGAMILSALNCILSIMLLCTRNVITILCGGWSENNVDGIIESYITSRP
jgi:hypothetical protein